MRELGYAALVFAADAVGALLAGWYLDLRAARRVRATVLTGGALTLVGGLNLLGFIAAGWPMLAASVAGAMVGDRLSFLRPRGDPVKVDDPRRCTTDGAPPRPGLEGASAPAPVDPRTGQHEAYWVLCAAERAKGFVRPVRATYVHVGPPGPTYPTRELTPEERARHAGTGYVLFEPYPVERLPVTGRFWTAAQLATANRGCGTRTTMGRALAETYARDPGFYGATFCVGCRAHLPVDEFVWDGTTVRVGT